VSDASRSKSNIMHSTFSSRPLRVLPLLVPLCGLCLAVMLPPASAQQTPAPAPAVPAVPAALQDPVSLTARRQPLGELLREVQRQTGVEVQADAPGLEAKLVTLRVKNMPLASLLAALGKLYGTEARKDDKGRYKLQPSSRTAFERLLPQLGSAQANYDEAQMKNPVDWAAEVFGNVNPAALRSKEGVALTDLPEDLQAQLREKIEASNLFFAASLLRLQTPEGVSEGVLKAHTYKIITSDPQGLQRQIEKVSPEVLSVQILDEQSTPLIDFQLSQAKPEAHP